MGLCIFDNVAAADAKDVLGVGRIAVVDWDVHHGNGTQEIWYEDPSVPTISIPPASVFLPSSARQRARARFTPAVNCRRSGRPSPVESVTYARWWSPLARTIVQSGSPARGSYCARVDQVRHRIRRPSGRSDAIAVQ
ncbi:hypothetical protein [Nocardia sp. R7R-8]|uniref:hypothetical protein n=1 Tax=Nocardia sp. R7R-8 TaxID=3459304 RepID=UPI00403D7FCF